MRIYTQTHTYIIPVICTVNEKTFGTAESNTRIVSFLTGS